MSAIEAASGGLQTAAIERAAITFRWDLDKTYLRTQFESLRQMVKIPFEAGSDKVHLPGVPQLIHALRRCAVARAQRPFVFFLSASPPQIGSAIREKLDLDGIEYDGIIFKDQLRNLVRGRWRSLREHLGYKLGELLESRRIGPAASREVLFGDDWESDPIIYSLYADIVAGRMALSEVDDILQAIGVDPQLIVEAKQLATKMVPAAAVSRIFINLERRTPPSNFQRFGPRLVPTFNYLQTAACLFQDGHLTLPAVAAVAQALIGQSGYTPERLANSLADIERRGHLQPVNAIAVREYLAALGALPQRARPRQRQSPWLRVRRLFTATPQPPPAADALINYQALVAEWRR